MDGSALPADPSCSAAGRPAHVPTNTARYVPSSGPIHQSLLPAAAARGNHPAGLGEIQTRFPTAEHGAFHHSMKIINMFDFGVGFLAPTSPSSLQMFYDR